MEIRDRYRDYVPVYTDGSQDRKLPVTASILTAKVWAVIKALEQITYSVVSKYIIFRDELSGL